MFLSLFLWFSVLGLTVGFLRCNEPTSNPIRCIIPPSECDTDGVVCPLVYDPVCGCDGKTYENECYAKVLHCNRFVSPGPCPNTHATVENFIKSVTSPVNAESNCPSDTCLVPIDQCYSTPVRCGINIPSQQVCGCDGITYENPCVARFVYCNRCFTAGPCI
jgi:hypothetical protein